MFVEGKNDSAQNVWSTDLVYKKPFGYPVIHHGIKFNVLCRT